MWFSFGETASISSCAVYELSVITVNMTSACRDMIWDYTVTQALETVIGSRGRHGIKKWPTRIIFRVDIWIMVEFSLEDAKLENMSLSLSVAVVFILCGSRSLFVE